MLVARRRRLGFKRASPPAEGLLRAASSALEEHQRKGSFGRKTKIRRRFQQISRDLKRFKGIYMYFLRSYLVVKRPVAGEGRLGGELLRKAREAAQAAKASEQWSVLMAAQHIIGRSDTAVAWKEMQQELHRRRERLIQQARSFLLISAMLSGGAA